MFIQVYGKKKTLMYKKGNYADLSDFALHYIGGILKHAPSLLAFVHLLLTLIKD